MVNYEKKTYKTFIIILIAMIITIPIAGISLKNQSISKVIKMIFSMAFIYITLIAFIIYKKERVYWISTYTYDAACKMRPEDRRKIGFNFFKMFGTATIVFILYSIIGTFIGTTALIDTLIFIGILIATCFIKL